MKKLNLLLAFVTVAILFVTSCKKGDPVIPNEEEVITTLKYTLTPEGGGTSVVLTFQDLDGDGGTAPTITGGILDANTTYTGTVVLLNEMESPAEDITEEILEEALEHQLFYIHTIEGVDITYNDTDADGNPIGVATTVKTAATGAGTITVVLRHEPNKNATGVSDGDITNAGGETDIEVTFNVEVQ